MTSINIVQHFENVQLSGMRLASLVVVPSGRKVRSVVAAMAAQHTGCAVVTDAPGWRASSPSGTSPEAWCVARDVGRAGGPVHDGKPT